jgi:hypothetical protein
MAKDRLKYTGSLDYLRDVGCYDIDRVIGNGEIISHDIINTSGMNLYICSVRGEDNGSYIFHENEVQII